MSIYCGGSGGSEALGLEADELISMGGKAF